MLNTQIHRASVTVAGMNITLNFRAIIGNEKISHNEKLYVFAVEETRGNPFP